MWQLCASLLSFSVVYVEWRHSCTQQRCHVRAVPTVRSTSLGGRRWVLGKVQKSMKHETQQNGSVLQTSKHETILQNKSFFWTGRGVWKDLDATYISERGVWKDPNKIPSFCTEDPRTKRKKAIRSWPSSSSFCTAFVSKLASTVYRCTDRDETT
jgi:hypothetical protein